MTKELRRQIQARIDQVMDRFIGQSITPDGIKCMTEEIMAVAKPYLPTPDITVKAEPCEDNRLNLSMSIPFEIWINIPLDGQSESEMAVKQDG